MIKCIILSGNLYDLVSGKPIILHIIPVSLCIHPAVVFCSNQSSVRFCHIERIVRIDSSADLHDAIVEIIFLSVDRLYTIDALAVFIEIIPVLSVLHPCIYNQRTSILRIIGMLLIILARPHKESISLHCSVILESIVCISNLFDAVLKNGAVLDIIPFSADHGPVVVLQLGQASIASAYIVFTVFFDCIRLDHLSVFEVIGLSINRQQSISACTIAAEIEPCTVPFCPGIPL